jgi:small redox-active disulfide protein 2
MNIKILGGGCAKCKQLEKMVRKAIVDLDIDATIEKVTQQQDIMAYPIMSTPALVLDEVVVLSGRVAKPEELKRLIEQHRISA